MRNATLEVHFETLEVRDEMLEVRETLGVRERERALSARLSGIFSLPPPPPPCRVRCGAVRCGAVRCRP